ncbi:hypothetical protein [Inquilinus sp. OTU3971]|uniref:hypothetical protein n=1 Tax=Inquilinus sp. OTU3971 TaxID=3043855 RepID=UPI00313C5BFB
MSDETTPKRQRRRSSAELPIQSTLDGPTMPAACTAGPVEVEQLDGRTMAVRRYKSACDGLIAQLGGNPSVSDTMLVRRCASLMSYCEAQDARQAAGEDIDISHYARAALTLGTMLKALGLAIHSKSPRRSDVIDAHSAAILDA